MTRIDEAFEGCYEAPRAAALSGVPVSTVYYWARKGIVVPSISMTRTKLWSYADLMGLRVVYWLRHPEVREASDSVPASPMPQVRQALELLEERGLDIWTQDAEGGDWSPLVVDGAGRVHIVTDDGVDDFRGRPTMGFVLLGPFEVGDASGPDLVRPRPHLRIVPGKLSGEPHLQHSRLTTLSVAALSARGYDVDAIHRLYPDQDPMAIGEAIDLEDHLAAAAAA